MKLYSSFGEVDFLVLDDSTCATATNFREQCQDHVLDIVVDLSETVFEVRSQCLYCQMKYFVLLSFHNLGENWTEDVQDTFNVSGGEVYNILVHNNTC